jgi:hypothetical protein
VMPAYQRDDSADPTLCVTEAGSVWTSDSTPTGCLVVSVACRTGSGLQLPAPTSAILVEVRSCPRSRCVCSIVPTASS